MFLITLGILNGSIGGAMKDIVVINTGFGISAVEGCSLKESFEKSKQMIDERVGIRAIENLKTVSNSFN